jgi:hypothetical protein
MRKLILGMALVGLVGTGQIGQAQDYPPRPVMMIVPLAAGGAAAAETVGAGRVARAAPDCYTIAAGDQTSFALLVWPANSSGRAT